MRASVLPFPLLLLALAGPAAAQASLHNVATGLGVTVPQGYVVEEVVRPGLQAVLGIKPAGERPRGDPASQYVCELWFMAVPANARFAQAELNARWDDDFRHEASDAELRRYFSDYSKAMFMVGDAAGREVVGTPNAPADQRVVLSVIVTPKGRIVLTCATLADDFDAALPSLRAIREGIVLPR